MLNDIGVIEPLLRVHDSAHCLVMYAMFLFTLPGFAAVPGRSHLRLYRPD